MKKLLTAIFLVLFLPLSAQVTGEYIIESRVSIKPNNSSYGDGCQNFARIDVLFSENKQVRIFEQDFNSIPSEKYTDFGIQIHKITAYPNLSLLKLKSSASRNWKRTLGGCGGRGAFNNSEKEKDIYFGDNSYINNDAIRWWNHEIHVKIFPDLKIIDFDSSNNFLPTDHKIKIESHIGFASSEYNWEYSIDGINYISLPDFKGQSTINVNAYDILGNQTLSQLGKIIFVRQNANYNTQVPVISNIVQFTVLPSAPKILSTTDKSGYTSCFYESDGKLRLLFDRPLNKEKNETINLTVTNVNNPLLSISIPNIETFDADNSFLIENLAIGNYKIEINGKSNNIPTYSETTITPYQFEIKTNDPVDFSISKVDVWCFEGSDGEILITASGGTQSGYEYQINNTNWIAFSDNTSATHTIKNLPQGSYKIKVRDKNGCISKVQVVQDGKINLDAEKELAVTINAPQAPLALIYTVTKEPTFYGATNGKIVAQISGGTIFDDKTYWFEWKNQQGEVLVTTTQYVSGYFYINLENIPAGKFQLTIRDKNYTSATDNAACTIIESEVELPQPDPLVAKIELVNPISCHVDNEFGNETDKNPLDGQRDESQDGALKVIVTGGRPFTGNANEGKPYKYLWKKQDALGNWQTLTNNNEVLAQLSDGNYAVNIEDSYGITIGVYQNNELVTPTDVTYYLKQPEKLNLTFNVVPVTCKGNDGKAKAIVSGGTSPYTFSWTNGETTDQISDLFSMSYFVTVTDARGCMIQGTINVPAPVDIEINEVITPLLCHDASNASINLNVNGSVAPYTYLWNTGETTQSITNLKAGTYTVSITDGQGCVYGKSYTIANPEKIVIDLGPNRTLCFGQSVDLDATIPNNPGTVYQWKNSQGFIISEQAKISVNIPDKYEVTAITPDGCTATSSILVFYNDIKIDSEFLLTTQAFVNQEVVLVNVSNPKGQTTEWIFDYPEIEVVNKNDDYITLNFLKTGTYNITLKQTQGNCFMLFDKEIIVEADNGTYNPNTTNNAFIKEFVVMPNPNNGNFEVKVELEKANNIKLRLFTVSGQLVEVEKKLPSAKSHKVNYNTQLSAGTYILVLETSYQTITKKIIIY